MMYYLLENNRIIDSENLKRKFPLEAKIGIIDNELIATLENFPIFRSESKIKKQSENVFDLLENGDLVKFRYGKIIELCDFQDNANNFVNYLKDCLPEKILAIYKPDAKGNYIKVWEVKENVD